MKAMLRFWYSASSLPSPTEIATVYSRTASSNSSRRNASLASTFSLAAFA
jgi:hypothetical protein